MADSKSGVISFRTELYEQLKDLAKSRNVSISNVSAEIIEKYLNYYQHMEERKYISYPREMLSTLYSCLDKKEEFDQVAESALKNYVRELKFLYSAPTLEEIAVNLKMWFDNNGFMFKIKKSDEGMRFFCTHDMGINWSKSANEVLQGIFKKFNMEGATEEVTKDFFAFKIKQ